MTATPATRCPVSNAARRGTPFDPGAALAALEVLAARRPTVEAARAWDAAWIACLTNSPRWAETARRDYLAATAGSANGA